jgi:hypothetical protein
MSSVRGRAQDVCAGEGEGDLPGCDAGAGGRLVFVVREVATMIRRAWRVRR